MACFAELHACVWGGGDMCCRVAVLLRWGYWECCSRKIQAFSKCTQHPFTSQTRAPRRSWKVTFHRVLRGFPRRAGALVRDTFTLPPLKKKKKKMELTKHLLEGLDPHRKQAVNGVRPPPPTEAAKRPATPATLWEPAVGRPRRGGESNMSDLGWRFASLLWK